MGRRRTIPRGPSGMEIMRAKSELQNKIDKKVSSEVPQVKHEKVPARSSGTGGHWSLKSPMLVEEICDRITKGESLTHICKDDRMPAIQTVMSWVAKDPDFRERYYAAKEAQADFFSEEIIDIADDSTSDIMQGFDRKGKPIPMVNYENVKRSELRIKARQWLMERVKFSRFNEKVLVAQQEAQNPAIPNLSGATIQIVLPDNGRKVIDVGAD